MKNIQATADKTGSTRPERAHVAPEKTSSKRAASRKEGAPEGRETANGGKIVNAKAAAPKKAAKPNTKAVKPTAAKKSNAQRAESKGERILEMLGRAKGATLAEIMKATDWQAHSVRGFISTAAKKGAKIDSRKNEAGDRQYKIAR
jgi:hypothetical protein